MMYFLEPVSLHRQCGTLKAGLYFKLYVMRPLLKGKKQHCATLECCRRIHYNVCSASVSLYLVRKMHPK